MKLIEELDQILIDCSEKLVDCSSIIRDIPLEPRRENIHRIGHALAEIGDLRNEIYKLYPDLKPDGWDEPPIEEAYGEMYENASIMVREHIEAGNIDRAVECLESFIFMGPSKKYEELAKNQIQKIKKEHGV